MRRTRLTRAEELAIDDSVVKFEEHRLLFDRLGQSLVEIFTEDEALKPYIHFIKYRVKSRERLRDKLEKRCLESRRGAPPAVTAENLFETINDLVGVRILHLHTDQLRAMNDAICRIVDGHGYLVREGPTANCWDQEYESILRDFGFETRPRRTMYMSVHYVLQANERTKVTAELQVRTLMEEVWGEVSHRVAYESNAVPTIIDSQVRVLARLTSGTTRLVDTIFQTHQESRGE